METSRASQLEAYAVEEFHVNDESGSYDMMKITCPRRACGESFWAHRGWCVIKGVLGRDMDPPANVIGRPCPYCSRASVVPEEFRIYNAEPEAKPRIVKRRRRK